MGNLTDYPLLVFVVSFLALWGAALLGAAFKKRERKADEGTREDFGVILAAILTLLGLIIGFSFSMAISRYDQRKNLEEEEANAIGTEILRADLLPEADAAKVRALLATYLAQRVQFYTTRDQEQLRDINARTAKLQAELWSTVKTPAVAQPSAVTALAVAGMNDVLNSQGYTQAAWWNRIPHAAWGLMGAIADLLQSADRLRRAQPQDRVPLAPRAAARRRTILPADRRYRQPTRRCYPSRAAEPPEPGSIPARSVARWMSAAAALDGGAYPRSRAKPAARSSSRSSGSSSPTCRRRHGPCVSQRVAVRVRSG